MSVKRFLSYQMLFQQELFEAIADLAVAAASHAATASMAVRAWQRVGCRGRHRRGRKSGCNALC